MVLAGAIIGKDCNICSHCFIENDVVTGDRVTIKNGVSLFDSLRIEDDVFIGPNVTFTNDVYPQSRRGTKRDALSFPKTTICKGASIGGGATLLPGVEICEYAIVDAGAVVTKNVAPHTIIRGDRAAYERDIVVN